MQNSKLKFTIQNYGKIVLVASILLFPVRFDAKVLAQGDSLQFGAFTPPPAKPTVIKTPPYSRPTATLPPEATTAPTLFASPTPYIDPGTFSECDVTDLRQEWISNVERDENYQKNFYCRHEICQALDDCSYLPVKDEQTVQVDQHVNQFHQISTALYTVDWYAFTKGLIRFSLRHGFGLDRKQELAKTLGVLTCAERVETIRRYISTPFYFYPQKNMPLELSLPTGNYSFLAKSDGTLITSDGQNLTRFDYKLPQVAFIKPDTGLIIKREHLYPTLESYAGKFSLNKKEASDFISYWITSLPKAPFYFISHFSKEEADSIFPWKTEPKPDTIIRLLMYFKPLLVPDLTSLLPPQFPHPVSRQESTASGFTVVDWAGIIDY